jgi:hypothetical protein
MPDAPPAETPKPDPAEAAEMLGTALNRLGIDYALGGAIALGYWAQPRGTLDVDLTRFLTPGDHQSVLDTLREIGCEFDPDAVRALLVEHSFCRARFRGVDVDVFLPMFDFYDVARQRRARVRMGDEFIHVWSAETLAVFKMMFFRRKDVVDVERLLRDGGAGFDREWVRAQLVEIFGARDPRIPAWDDLIAEVGESS